MSSSSWSDSCCSCARCSGVIELSIACAAAIRRAMTSSSSSSVWGFSGKKSPWRSMKPSKSGSSPAARCSSIWLSSAIMSFMRAMSSGDIEPIAPDIWSTVCCISCSRSLSISSSKRCCASLDEKSYCSRPLTWPARSGGSMSSSRFLPATDSWVSSARRGSPDSRAVVELTLELVALLLDQLAQLLRDVVVDTAQVVAVQRLLAALTDLVEHLADALDALAVAVLEALLHHPPQRRVEVAVVEQVVGQLLHDVERIDLEAALAPVPG